MGDKQLRTQLCDLLGIEYPIMLAGMGNVAYPPLVAAVSEAGGLGVLGMSRKAPWFIERCINDVRGRTKKPFGVDLTIPSVVPVSATEGELREEIPATHVEFVRKLKEEWGVPDPKEEVIDRQLHPDYNQNLFKAQVEKILEMEVPVFISGIGNPAWMVPDAHAQGMKVMALVGNTKQTRRVVEGGVDVVIAQGNESGGHTGRIGGLVLFPAVMEAAREVNPDIMVASAGGIATGQQIAACLAMGSVGVWCGTRFIATNEAYEAGDWWKEKIVRATEEDTIYSRYGDGMALRNLRPAKYLEAWETSGLPLLPMGQQRLVGSELLRGAREAEMWDIVGGAGGQGAGLINEVKSAGEVVEDMVAETLHYLEEVLPRTTGKS